MKKSLAEWIRVEPTGDAGKVETHEPHDDLVVDNALAAWGGIGYAELSLLLVHLRFLALLHQTHHWIAKGDPYFGDHKLFEQLYNTVVEEIDDVGEKAVGLGNEQNVNLPVQISQLHRLSKAVGTPQTIPQSCELARMSMVAESNFLKVLVGMLASLKQSGASTPGVENMLGQLADTHERHLYLLKRRCSSSALGF